MDSPSRHFQTNEFGDAEPEDDFNAAWEVLDLARAIYAKQTEDGGDEDVQLKLADTYIALGDVSLETAPTQLAPDRGSLGDAITHAERALESIECRLAELASPPAVEAAALPPDPKGKGKGKSRLVRDDLVSSMSAAQIEGETKELAGLKEDLALKELKTRPDEPMKNASALVAQALDAELGAHSGANGTGSAQVVNDLTSIVVKKKKKPAPAPAEVWASHERRGLYPKHSKLIRL
ncbi:hypothetical protein B0H13DRAFT_2344044 [Mycena leptocephala]|nr:hypothetical protein B0H13DRAFT_2344044 [Mycena leptocephala]